MLRSAPAIGAWVLLLLCMHASARTLSATAQKPEFVFSNELLLEAAKKAPTDNIPPLPEAMPGGRAGAKVVPVSELPLGWPRTSAPALRGSPHGRVAPLPCKKATHFTSPLSRATPRGAHPPAAAL